ncbi:MAG: acyl-CoA dehydrogenase family protein [Armatimonadetes bacterium]|nr:acyl-CoA dehydrogenase family protein [Armatimonadota bacterium]
MDFSLSEEERQIQKLARDFARKEILPAAVHYDETATFPHPVVEKARELGLVSMAVPEEHGGIGLSPLGIALVAEELAWGCAGIAVAITLNCLVADALGIAASDEQKQIYYPRLAEGFGAYALTEPGAGSDAAALQTRAVDMGDHYVLQGSKTWISHAPEASFFVVFAKTDVEAGTRGITAFLVDRERPGVSVSKSIPKMGQRASSAAEVTFDQVEVPSNAVLGRTGEGFKIAMRVFDRSRPLVAAIAVGVARRCLEESLRYATERKAFEQPIAAFQGVGFKLAEMGMRTEAARLLTHKAAWKLGHHQGSTLDAAYAKAFAADTAMWAAVEAVQVHGGYGYSKEFPVEKLMRDAKVLQIYEGTSEIQRTIMVRELTRAVPPR